MKGLVRKDLKLLAKMDNRIFVIVLYAFAISIAVQHTDLIRSELDHRHRRTHSTSHISSHLCNNFT